MMGRRRMDLFQHLSPVLEPQYYYFFLRRRRFPMITKNFMIFFPFCSTSSSKQWDLASAHRRSLIWYFLPVSYHLTSPSSHIAVVVRAPRAIVSFLSLTRQFRNWRSHFYDNSGLRSSSHSFAHFYEHLSCIIFASSYNSHLHVSLLHEEFMVLGRKSLFSFFCLISPSSSPRKKSSKSHLFARQYAFSS